MQILIPFLNRRGLSVKLFSFVFAALLIGWTHPCPAQTPVDDFLPLSVGNQWTYKYLTSSAEYLADMSYHDSGVVRYSVVSKTEAADSILWGFTEIRNIVQFGMHTYPPQYSYQDTITDTTSFSLIEYKAGNHRLIRTGRSDWKSVFSMTPGFSDSLSYFRYHPEVSADTFTATAASPADNPYQAATTLYRRYQGIVKTSYKQTRIVGSTASTNHTLIDVTLPVPNVDSLRREFYPLHKGDIWQYATAMLLQPAHQLVPQVVTVVDTLLPNGYRYAGLSYTNAPDKIFKFVRVDSLLRVQEYRPELGDTCGGGMNELNTFRLGERDSAFWSVCSKMGMTYLPPKILLRFDGFSADGEYMYFTPGDPRDGGSPQWSFLSHQLRRGVGVWLQPNDADGPETFLWGAVIDGKKYGNTITAVEDHSSSEPLGFSLAQNYPNPFNPSTTIAYTVPTRSHVLIKIFNALGQSVATVLDEMKAPGRYTAIWNAAHLSSGIYYYQMRAGAFVQTHRMAIIK